MGGILTGRFVGSEVMVDDIRRYTDTIRSRLKDAVAEFASIIAAQAKANIHTRSGTLASSIRWTGEMEQKRIIASIGTDEFYGRFLESGWTPNPHRGTKGKDWAKGWGKGWKRNPRSRNGRKADWNAYLRERGSRNIYAYPFLKPPIWDLAPTIRQRLTDITEGR